MPFLKFLSILLPILALFYGTLANKFVLAAGLALLLAVGVVALGRQDEQDSGTITQDRPGLKGRTGSGPSGFLRSLYYRFVPMERRPRKTPVDHFHPDDAIREDDRLILVRPDVSDLELPTEPHSGCIVCNSSVEEAQVIYQFRAASLEHALIRSENALPGYRCTTCEMEYVRRDVFDRVLQKARSQE